jgi:methylenetetrahydrofolate reductase (NADPH)
MRLDQLYRSKKPDISIELFPPKTPEGVLKLFETVERLKMERPAFFSVTFGAGGSTRDLTIDLCRRLKQDSGVEVMCHLNIVGQSRNETAANLQKIKQSGIYNLLALRGDPPQNQTDFKPHPDGFHSSFQLVEEARKNSWFAIGVSGFPEIHPDAKGNRAQDIAYLKKKVDAGACVIFTQLFLDNRFFFEFVDLVRKAGISVPVVPGILPILSAGQIRRFTALCGSSIPPEVEKNLKKYEADDAGAAEYGVELASAQCSELLKSGVPGLHFYALNRDASVRKILSNL